MSMDRDLTPHQRALGDIITNATLPGTMATAIVPMLKRTAAYEAARRERRSRAWLNAESKALGDELAKVVSARLAALGEDAALDQGQNASGGNA